MLLLLLTGWWLLLPSPLFDVPYSTVLLDRDDEILGMTVAEDEQFRFPEIKVLPLKYMAAVITFEDHRFGWHRGVDPQAVLRAFYQNIKAGKVVSGGSTISMQVIRLARNNPPRTIPEKLLEMLLALRLEMSYTKEEILCLYASYAPFGGNIVGMQAAAKKYFNRHPDLLSWGEAAFLAVLPNAPSLKNRERLKEKRDRLLNKLCESGYMEREDCVLAIAEPLPDLLWDTPCIAPHLLSKATSGRKGEICASNLDAGLQRQVNDIVARHSRMLSTNMIYNVSVLVAHVPSGEVRAYVGNSPALAGSRGNDVDIITSVRSSGSILKPILYALMLQNGYILPGTLVSDTPSRFGSYSPSNFSRTFQGVAPADKALTMSLNIPFVRMLKEYGYTRFYDELKQLGIRSLNRPADDYGLSLILGGAETSLWDLCNLYGGMVSVLRHYNENDGNYYEGEYERLQLWRTADRNRKNPEPGSEKTQKILDARFAPLKASALWQTLRTLREVERPEMESGWKTFASRSQLSWKTGTSFGFRDAWAVGVNPDWVIGVWVGNADGEGRPGLVGVKAAAPVLFEVANLLPVDNHFYMPVDEMKELVVCKKSGYRASSICEHTDTIKACVHGERTPLCHYHKLVHLDQTGKWRVSSECERIEQIQVTPWFILSPVQEWYYRRSHSDYRPLPPYRSDCFSTQRDVMEMIYPQKGTRVFVPKDFGGKRSKVIFELAHRLPHAEVYWHVDDEYLGMTRYYHQMEISAGEGFHRLNLVDGDGNTLTQSFRIVGRD